MQISLVVAVAENGAIGKNNTLLWRLPDDLKYFKSITLGKPVVMGRKTYDSIGKPLPGRRNLIVSRQSTLQLPGCEVFPSLDAAIRAAADVPEVMIIGGADIYRQALPLAQRVYLTRVHARFEGDVFFPDIPAGEWRTTHTVAHAADERHAYPFTFLTLQRGAS